jgi:amino acid transporter
VGNVQARTRDAVSSRGLGRSHPRDGSTARTGMSQFAPQAPGEGSLRYAGWGVLAAAFTGVMCSFAPIVPYTFSLFLDPLHAAFGWKREAMGGTFALAAITVALVSPVMCSTVRPYGENGKLMLAPGL